jgi:hypothetical protein
MGKGPRKNIVNRMPTTFKQRPIKELAEAITALRLRYRSLGIGRDPAEPELLGVLFLLVGKKALEEFGTLLHVDF